MLTVPADNDGKAPPDPKTEEVLEVAKETGMEEEEEKSTAKQSSTENAEAVDDSANGAELDAARKLQRRTRNESYLTAGCGYTKRKTRLLAAFWGTLWKELERNGWKKVEGTGNQEGSIRFFPPIPKDKNFDDVEREGRRGKDYYDRITDVIGRVRQGRNSEEKRASELFHAVFGIEEKRKPRIAALGKRRRGASNSSAELAESSTQPSLAIDTSWKNGGILYPKASSRVGEEFQATEIPAAGTHILGAQSGLYERIWDPESPKETIITKILEERVPPNKREQALVALCQADFETFDSTNPVPEKIVEIIMNLKAVDGSDWSREEKETYEREIFRLRKDLTQLSKSIGKDLKTCYTYYLANYKQSDEYRMLKTVCVEERNEKAYIGGHHGVDACAVCGDGGSLIICDGCEGEYHIDCLRPRLITVPEGHWECDECVNKKLLGAREYIVSKSDLYEPLQVGNGEGTVGEQTDEERMADLLETTSNEIVFRPKAEVLSAVREFAVQIEKVFTAGITTTS